MCDVAKRMMIENSGTVLESVSPALRARAIEELGDLFCCILLACGDLGTTLEEICAVSRDKLEVRVANGTILKKVITEVPFVVPIFRCDKCNYVNIDDYAFDQDGMWRGLQAFCVKCGNRLSKTPGWADKGGVPWSTIKSDKKSQYYLTRKCSCGKQHKYPLARTKSGFPLDVMMGSCNCGRFAVMTEWRLTRQRG